MKDLLLTSLGLIADYCALIRRETFCFEATTFTKFVVTLHLSIFLSALPSFSISSEVRTYVVVFFVDL